MLIFARENRDVGFRVWSVEYRNLIFKEGHGAPKCQSLNQFRDCTAGMKILRVLGGMTQGLEKTLRSRGFSRSRVRAPRPSM